MSFANRGRPPITLTDVEQARLLSVSGEHRNGFRDHIIFAIALGTALREFEIAALNVGDVITGKCNRGTPGIKRRITLTVFKRCTLKPAPQQVFLPDSLVHKMRTFIKWKIGNGESVNLDAPLFISRKGNRISPRTLRFMFANWQKRAGFDRRFTFHHLRHTALTNIYRRTRDIRVVQRAARHSNINTTTIYATPTDEDILRAVRDLPC